MMKKFREMTWDMHAFHLFLFVLGAVALIVYAIHHDNPKLEGDHALAIIAGVTPMGTAIWSFLMCLFGREEGKYHPYMTEEEKERMTTSNKK